MAASFFVTPPPPWRPICLNVHPVAAEVHFFPHQQALPGFGDCRAMEIVRSTKLRAWSVDIQGNKCDNAVCDLTQTGNWRMYSVERFYTAPVVSQVNCYTSDDDEELYLMFHTWNNFKQNIADPGYYELEAKDGDSVTTGNFSFAPHWAYEDEHQHRRHELRHRVQLVRVPPRDEQVGRRDEDRLLVQVGPRRAVRKTTPYIGIKQGFVLTTWSSPSRRVGARIRGRAPDRGRARRPRRSRARC